MEKLEAVRMLDDLGRIVLPFEVRHALEWGEKTPLEVWLNEEAGEVVLKAHTYACSFCGATENLKEYNKRHLCPACQKGISEL